VYIICHIRQSIANPIQEQSCHELIEFESQFQFEFEFESQFQFEFEFEFEFQFELIRIVARLPSLLLVQRPAVLLV